jgi:hypothetical protein
VRGRHFAASIWNLNLEHDSRDEDFAAAAQWSNRLDASSGASFYKAFA